MVSQAKGPFDHTLQQDPQQVRKTGKMEKIHVVWSFLGHNFDQHFLGDFKPIAILESLYLIAADELFQ